MCKEVQGFEWTWCEVLWGYMGCSLGEDLRVELPSWIGHCASTCS